jgi:tetratricopeptide (TPR) repeat protein
MGIINTTIQSLFSTGGAIPPSTDKLAISLQVVRLYGFLPPPIIIEFDGESVDISFSDKSENDKAEAERLAEHAAEHASAGRCERALEVWRRALQLQPTRSITWRDIGMVCVQLGRAEEARGYLLTALRLDPNDVGNLVAMANFSIAHDNDYVEGERFAREALSAEPDNACALNTLGVILARTGRGDEATQLFLTAIRADSEFGPPYLSLAYLSFQQGRYEESLERLEELFEKAKMHDIRSRPVFENAHRLFLMIQQKVSLGRN